MFNKETINRAIAKHTAGFSMLDGSAPTCVHLEVHCLRMALRTAEIELRMQLKKEDLPKATVDAWRQEIEEALIEEAERLLGFLKCAPALVF